MSNTYFYKKYLTPKRAEETKVLKCIYEGCDYLFKRANKNYCPEHSDVMRIKRHKEYSERQVI